MNQKQAFPFHGRRIMAISEGSSIWTLKQSITRIGSEGNEKQELNKNDNLLDNEIFLINGRGYNSWFKNFKGNESEGGGGGTKGGTREENNDISSCSRGSYNSIFNFMTRLCEGDYTKPSRIAFCQETVEELLIYYKKTAITIISSGLIPCMETSNLSFSSCKINNFTTNNNNFFNSNNNGVINGKKCLSIEIYEKKNVEYLFFLFFCRQHYHICFMMHHLELQLNEIRLSVCYNLISTGEQNPLDKRETVFGILMIQIIRRLIRRLWTLLCLLEKGRLFCPYEWTRILVDLFPLFNICTVCMEYFIHIERVFDDLISASGELTNTGNDNFFKSNNFRSNNNRLLNCRTEIICDIMTRSEYSISQVLISSGLCSAEKANSNIYIVDQCYWTKLN